MTEIRPFSSEFADATANLYFRAMRGRTVPPSPALARYFCEILLANPWATPEIPSLVCLENGAVTAALGVIPRPMEFRGKEIRAATLTQFMVDPDHRRSPASMQLLRRCFEGPQDMTWVDGASDPVHLFHKACGSLPAYFYSLHWMRILRPFALGRDFLTRLGDRGRVLHRVAGIVSTPSDLVMTRLKFFRPPHTPCSWREVTPDELLECIREIGWREPLKPRYDAASFRWLSSQASTAQAQGRFRTIVVHEAAGNVCGWLAYFAKAGGTAYLLQLGIRRADHFELVLRALFADAWELGCAVVKGPSRPEYLTVLTRNHCALRHPGSSALIHSRNPDLLNTVRLGEAALSGLDGERWQRFSSETWD